MITPDKNTVREILEYLQYFFRIWTQRETIPQANHLIHLLPVCNEGQGLVQGSQIGMNIRNDSKGFSRHSTKYTFR